MVFEVTRGHLTPNFVYLLSPRAKIWKFSNPNCYIPKWSFLFACYEKVVSEVTWGPLIPHSVNGVKNKKFEILTIDKSKSSYPISDFKMWAQKFKLLCQTLSFWADLTSCDLGNFFFVAIEQKVSFWYILMWVRKFSYFDLRWQQIHQIWGQVTSSDLKNHFYVIKGPIASFRSIICIGLKIFEFWPKMTHH